jgi:hypothetical protein
MGYLAALHPFLIQPITQEMSKNLDGYLPGTIDRGQPNIPFFILFSTVIK